MDKSDLFYHESVIKCKDYAWNEKYSLAHEALKERLHLPRERMEDIWVYVSISMITGVKEDRTVALKQVAEVDKLLKQYSSESKLETIINANGKNDEQSKLNWKLDLKLVGVEATFVRAMMQLRQGSPMKGALNLRSAWKMVQALQKEIDSYGDKVHIQIRDQTKLFSAIFLILVSFAPYFLQRILEFLGFVANRELGVNLLKEVASHIEGQKAPRAAMFLLMNYLLLPRGLSKPEENLIPAEKLLQVMRPRFPGSAVFLWMQSMLFIKTGEIEQALECGKKALEACSELPRAPGALCANLAFNHYMARDFASASKLLIQITEAKDSEFDMRGLCGLQLATCYYMLGDEKSAYSALEKIPSLVSKSNRYDKIAEKKALSIKKRGFGFVLFEVLYIRRDLHHLKIKDCNEMLTLLEDQKKKQNMDIDHESVYYLMKGVLKKGIGENQAARDLFEKVLSLEKQIKEESWTVACCHLELAEFAYAEGNLDKAETHFKTANAHSGNDYMDLLHSRITSSLDVIKKEKQAKGLVYVEEKKEDDTGLEEELKKASIDVNDELD